MTPDLLQTARLAMAILMLAGAAVLDMRSRRVPNAYWFPFVAVAAALLAIDAGLHGAAALGLMTLAAGLAVGAFAYLAFRLGLFGGADAKALMVLAGLVPTLPPDAALPLPFALDTLMNGTAASLAFPVLLLAWNLAHGNLRLPAALLGVRMPIAQARAAHVWPMQRVAEDGRIVWRYWTRIRMDADEEYGRLAAAGLAEVWVTWKIPMVAFLAVGAVVAAVWGNILLRLAEAFAAP